MDMIFDECRKLREAGHKEYAHEENDTFDNFNRLSKLLGLPREQILLVYLMKHIDGIASYVKGHQSQREDIRGRINDAIVYLTLLRGMIVEKEDVPTLTAIQAQMARDQTQIPGSRKTNSY